MRVFFPVRCAICLVLLVIGGLPAATLAAATRPNVVVVLLDDMGYADLTCYGERRIQTRQIDRMATEGIRFTQYYANSPICSPSRTALLTGQHPARWKITSYLADRRENERRGMAQWLDQKAPSIARELKAAGYATGHFGKWHMGGQRDVGDAPLISEYGFDRSLTNFEGLGDRLLPLCDAFDGTAPKPHALGSDKLGRGTITWMDRSKITGGYVDAAMKFIRSARENDKPFYVNVWPDDVHSPFFPPAARRGDGTKKQLYLGVVQSADDQLGPLFELLRSDPKLRDNTIVIIASDNGPEPGAGSAGSFRGQKGNLYEGGVREPFIVWAPGLMEKPGVGTTNEKTVIAAYDVLPSLLSITGRPLPAGTTFDGEDMTSALLGRSQPTRTRPVLWVRPPDRPGPAANPWPDLSMRDGDLKLLMAADGTAVQVYDLAKDPGERTNLADTHADRVRAMKAALTDWYQSLPVRLPPRSPAKADAD